MVVVYASGEAVIMGKKGIMQILTVSPLSSMTTSPTLHRQFGQTMFH
jgi:hypothetical protein